MNDIVFCCGVDKNKNICPKRMKCMRYLLGEKTKNPYASFIVIDELDKCDYFIKKK